MNEEQSQIEEQEQNITETGMARIPFSREDLINAHSLRNTEYRDNLICYIESAHLYAASKRALKSVVNNFFSSNWFMANLEKGGRNSATYTDEVLSARLRMELDLLMATPSFCPSDTRSPDMLNIISGIHSHFIPTLSRAKGPQREGIINRRQTIAQDITQTRYESPLSPQEPQPQREKKSFLSFLGGKR